MLSFWQNLYSTRKLSTCLEFDKHIPYQCSSSPHMVLQANLVSNDMCKALFLTELHILGMLDSCMLVGNLDEASFLAGHFCSNTSIKAAVQSHANKEI